MSPIVLIVALFQVFIPVALLGWVWRGRDASRLVWTMKTAAVACYFLAIGVVGVWGFVPWQTPYLLALLLIAAAARSFRARRTLEEPIRSRSVWAPSIVYGVGALAFLGIAVDAGVGYAPPPGAPVSLSFPLGEGNYIVLSGGNNAWLNGHWSVLKNERLRRYRGQIHAIDIVALNRFGVRASGILPDDLSRYAIYGMPVYAPCTGNVIKAERAAPDMVPPHHDRSRLAGNFVLLDCREAAVMLAHLMPGSVVVSEGDSVSEGQQVGRVGNSGRTDEPHLHIHALRLNAGGDIFDGEPLPMLFDGRYLVRNSRVTVD